MGRSRTRISKGLIGALVVVIALGVVFYFRNASKWAANNTARADTPKATPAQHTSTQGVQRDPTVLTAPAPTPTAPAPAPAPTTAPSTQPSAVAPDALALMNNNNTPKPPATPPSSPAPNGKAAPTTSVVMPRAGGST